MRSASVHCLGCLLGQHRIGTVTEPTLNMPTTPAQLTEMIASAIATALTNQQPVNRDLFNSANSGSISNASIGPEIENIGGHIIRPIISEVPV